VSFYDFLLLVHVLGAFALVAAFVAFWTMYLATGRLEAESGALVPTLVRPATVLVIAGSLTTLVFGVWLAIYLDGYELWDGWILASLGLWLVGVGTGERAGRVFGQPEGLVEAALRRRGLILQLVSTLAIGAVLLLMIFKPGA
jgi:uncharacterized membrane protein